MTSSNSSVSMSPRKRGRPPTARAQTPAFSPESKRLAAAILEVLAGARTPTDAAAALSISLPRYYQLEQRAVAGLVAACEPRGMGPRVSAERKVAALEKEVRRWQQECTRQQALVRTAQRAIGLAAPQPKPAAQVPGKRSKRRRRPAARALRAAAGLRADSSSPVLTEAVQPTGKNGLAPGPDAAAGVASRGESAP
jgi:hypothetical protein